MPPFEIENCVYQPKYIASEKGPLSWTVVIVTRINPGIRPEVPKGSL